jgi:hypothetical protein
MSTALEDISRSSTCPTKPKAKERLLAKRIIALAHQGERSAALLRDRNCSKSI